MQYKNKIRFFIILEVLFEILYLLNIINLIHYKYYNLFFAKIIIKNI